MRLFPLLLSTCLFLAGCAGVYDDAMEKVGMPKRKILGDRGEAARESQQEAKQQFASAIDRMAQTRLDDWRIEHGQYTNPACAPSSDG